MWCSSLGAIRCREKVIASCAGSQAFCDMEAYHSYEGTYEVNVLVAGRGATGISAIKAPAYRGKQQTAEGAQQ